MINFCLTNKPSLVNSDWQHKLNLLNGVWLYHDSGIEIVDSYKYTIVFCGILWEGKVADFARSVKQNGIFYAIVIGISISNGFSAFLVPNFNAVSHFSR